MSYTRPPFDAADATWQGGTPYTRPAFDQADATWQSALTDTVTGIARPTAHKPIVSAQDRVMVRGVASLQSHQPRAVGLGWVPVVGTMRPAAHRPRASAVGLSPVVGTLRASGHAPAVTAEVTVHRYVLAGVVRNQGAAVNRLVRAHRLSDGAVAGQAETIAGAFSIDVSNGLDDYYILPLDLDPAGTDYAPPVANRVKAVLVQDAA